MHWTFFLPLYLLKCIVLSIKFGEWYVSIQYIKNLLGMTNSTFLSPLWINKNSCDVK